MSSSGPVTGRRPVCSHCLRPAATCLCPWVSTVSPSVDLLILQHPLEVANAKGSARLLHMCMTGSCLAAGERFDHAELTAMLHADGRTPVLLYPDTPDPDAVNLPVPPPLPAAALAQPSRLRLVVLDGTWRKSRKMLYLNPALHGLPRLPLRAMPPSHYRIRKAHAPDQLSTLEASCYALAQIEGDSEKFRPVLDAFRGFVELLAQYQIKHKLAEATPERS